jgi:outer membrane protein assembly factor BamB
MSKISSNETHKIKKLCGILLVTLLALSSFLFFVESTNQNVVNASDASSNSLLQYEWSQMTGDSQSTFYSAGPAPNTPNILWKVSIPGLTAGVRSAFNGKVFVQTSTQTLAFDYHTGSILWKANVTGGIAKLDNTRMLVGTSCVETDTGNILWATPKSVWDNGGGATGNRVRQLYVAEEKMYYSGVGGITGTDWNNLVAMNFSDLSKPPTPAWSVGPIDGRSCGLTYGDGKLLLTSSTCFTACYDAKTGALLWETEITGDSICGGSYYMGRFLKGHDDGSFYCFNATTGAVEWRFEPGTFFGMWNCRCATAYGMVYMLNSDSYLYAMDVVTGDVVWTYKGEGNWYPGGPVVADGKIYQETGDLMYKDPDTGAPGKSEYVCLNATTGELIWKLPIELCAPSDPAAIAYGNLYLTVGVSPELSVQYTTQSNVVPKELWCISDEPQDWSMFRGDLEHTAACDQCLPTQLSVKWAFPTGGAVISSPTVVDGVVYVGSQDKNIYALDAETGTRIWNFTTGFRVRSSPAVADGKVYTGTDDGNMYCLDAKTGQQLWMASAGGVTVYPYAQAVVRSTGTAIIRSSPAVVDGKVYVGSLDNKTYCFNANNGNVIWSRDTGGPIATSPTIVDNAVYIASSTYPDGTLFKLDASDGSIIWICTIKNYLVGRSPASPELLASPTVAAGIVAQPANNVYYYFVNATTGVVEWNYTIHESGLYEADTEPLFSSVGYKDGAFYFPSFYFMISINATTHEEIWRTWLGREITASPSFGLGQIYTGSALGAVYVLDEKTGSKLSYYGIGSGSWSSPALYDSKLYIGNNDMSVYCFEEARDLSRTTYYASSSSPSTTPTTPAPEQTAAPTSTPTATSPAGSTAAPATVAPQQSPSSTESPIVTQSPASPVTEAPAVTSSANQDAESSSDVYIVVVAVVAIIAVIAAIALIMKRRK